jgi:hypothetical protein
VKVRNKVTNDDFNPIELMAEKIVGSRREYRDMTPGDRSKTRDIARQLHESGRYFTAQQERQSADVRGFVYVLTNPAWPNHVKIGSANDAESRAANYQTGSPYRDYELHSSVYFADCRWAEQEIHARLEPLRAEGEWFTMTPTQARSAIETLRQTI